MWTGERRSLDSELRRAVDMESTGDCCSGEGSGDVLGALEEP